MADLSGPGENREALAPANDLRFPSGEGYRPIQHDYTLEQVTRLSEERLSLVTGFSGFEEERLAAKCAVPFRLLP
jgi:hypothetical protein